MEAIVASDLMRPNEAASFLRVSRRCLSDMQRRRLIPFAKLGHRLVLFRRTDLNKMLSRRMVKAVGVA